MDKETTDIGLNQAAESFLTGSDAKIAENVNRIAKQTYEHYKNLGEARAGGYAAEQVHAEINNLSVNLTGKGILADAIDDNKLADIYLGQQKFQLKFCKTADATYKQVTQTFGDHYRSVKRSMSFDEWKQQLAKRFDIDPSDITENATYYQDMNFVVPSDQVETIRRKLLEQIEAAKKQGNHSEAVRLSKLKGKIADKLGNDSLGISKKQADYIGRTGKLPPELKQKLLENKQTAIIKKALKTGMSAAALSFAIEVAPKLLKMLTTGDFNAEEFTQDSIDGGLNATQSFAVASVSSWIMQTEGILKSATKNLSAEQVAALVLLTCNIMKSVGKRLLGKISSAQMAHDISRDTVVAGTTLLGSVAALALVPEAAGPVIVVQLVGSIVGAVVGSEAFDVGDKVILGLSAKYGWTLFGLVDQDYRLSDDQLKAMGFDVEEFDLAENSESHIDEVNFDCPVFDELQMDESEIQIIRRGVIGVNTIGYLSN
ncbi:hypothetical protein [Lactiplantibacillus plajomi]|uniref:Uncharacterized protein n=1 Tax=Lactiplantibacillus plajomi TaxID=1457217 RepID=A0ABV6K1Q9_9LACO|nr:hypothetical protein [Lactiplantibacillus plajomi]